jgi:hypothetical protein
MAIFTRLSVAFVSVMFLAMSLLGLQKPSDK